VDIVIGKIFDLEIGICQRGVVNDSVVLYQQPQGSRVGTNQVKTLNFKCSTQRFAADEQPKELLSVKIAFSS
jgi:hypothetical protein